MNRIRECITELADRMPAGAVTPLGDGLWRIADGADEVTAAVGGDDGDFICYATVGDLAGVGGRARVLENALKANCFWHETGGATLSVDPESGALVLADRREADFAEDGAGLAAFFTQFFDTLRRWKRYLADCASEAASAEASAPAGGFGAGSREMEIRP